MDFLLLLLGTLTSTTADVETVVVTDTRIERQTRDPTATATAIREQRLEDARRRGDDLAALVDQVAGVRVLDLGGPVAPSAITIRGGSPSQAALIVDGVVMRSPFATGLDPGLVHPESIADIEVVRGGLGSTYGDGALTGALVVRTLATGRPRTTGAVTFGSLGTLKLSAMSTMLPVSIAGSFERTDGRFDYVDRQIGLPDATFERVNNDHQRGTVSLATTRDIADGTLWVRAGGSIADSGTPGLSNAADVSGAARDVRRSGRAAVAWRQPLDDGHAEVRVSAFALDLDYRDPPRDVASDTTFTAVTAEGSVDFVWGGGQFFRADVSATQERSVSSVFGDVDRGRIALGVTDEVAFGDVVVHAGVRGAHVGPREMFVLPRLGAVWTTTTGFELVLGLGRALRSPSIDERYHPPEVGFSGNPNLQSESAWELEFAAKYLGDFEIASSVFARRITDTILYLNRNAFVVRPENVGDADALGGELEVSTDGMLSDFNLAAAASGSVLYSRLAATQERLPTQPVFSYAGQVSISRWEIELASFVRGFSRTFTRLRPSDDNIVRAYFSWDFAMTVGAFDLFTVSAVLKNVLDTRTLQTVNRFPLPGRTAFVTLRFRLDGARD